MLSTRAKATMMLGVNCARRFWEPDCYLKMMTKQSKFIQRTHKESGRLADLA